MDNPLIHYMTGVPKMDAEHVELFDLLGQLDSGISGDLWMQHFDTLRQRWIEHLQSEEELMAAVNYPYATHHKHEHNKLTIQVQGLIDKLQHDSSCDFRWLKRETETLIKAHIDHYDIQIGSWLNRAKQDEKK